MGVVGQSATRTDRLPIHRYSFTTDTEDLNKEQQLSKYPADSADSPHFPHFPHFPLIARIVSFTEMLLLLLFAVLRKVFDSFDHHKKGSIPSSMVQTIFTVMGHRVDAELLKSNIAEVDADGSGELEFPEFVQLAAQFLIEEDAEEMQNE